MTNAELKTQAEELIGKDELARRFRIWITNLIKSARMKLTNVDSSTLLDADIASILNDLNTRTKSRFTATDQAKLLIRARMKDGYQVQDFFRVHEVKALKWLGDPTTEAWLRPSTLYRPSHFDEYLAEWHAMDRQKRELDDKRAQSLNRTIPVMSHDNATTPDTCNLPSDTSLLERKAKIEELSQTPWYAFDSWSAFMKHTVLFPDAKALKSYPMPDRIRAMRTCPNNSMIKIYSGQRIESLEEEYSKICQQHHLYEESKDA